MKTKNSLLIICLFALIYSCKKEDPIIIDQPLPTTEFVADTFLLNPFGYSPLSAINYYTTDQKSRAEIIIVPKDENQEVLIKSSNSFEFQHKLTILGLYPDFLNTIYINYYNTSGALIDQQIHLVETGPLPTEMPEIIINRITPSEMEPGLTLVSYWGSRNPQKPFIVDQYGEIRWYLDYSEHPILNNLNYDNGIERLQNGNYYFGDITSNSIYEVSPLGEVINSWGLSNYEFHHNVQEKENGNFLVTVSNSSSQHQNGKYCIEDFVIEINRNSGSITTVWDLKNSLDETRGALTLIDNTNNKVDWFHGNAVIEDSRDRTIIVSGRTQGVVKLTNQNTPKWILATHKGWGNSRTETNLSKYLLTPLDFSGLPILDTNVLNGNQNHPQFEWPWYQHSPKLLPNGNLLIFDNGDNRNYESTTTYSRAVEYKIDEANKTIQQVWSYGKNRGDQAFARYVSDVDYLPIKNNILFSPGFSVINSNATGGKVIEIDYDTKKVIFEMAINPPGGFVTLHRAERLSLYP